MDINIIDTGAPEQLQPLSCDYSTVDVPVGGMRLEDALNQRLAPLATISSELIFSIRSDFWPSSELVEKLRNTNGEMVITGKNGEDLAWMSADAGKPADSEKIEADDKCVVIRYPWDFLAVNEDIVGSLDKDDIRGEVKNNVNIEGHIVLGEGSVILPGVFIEGNVIIGKDCKIGPNCYIRGKTSIGNKCHIGQAVEIKNSILMDKVSAGHLSYIGDTIVGEATNFGAGTITANFRHDGKNHRSEVNGELVDTGRRKFGSIIGKDVHTGIHTSIYPGRKIWSGKSTRPGDIVQRDIK